MDYKEEQAWKEECEKSKEEKTLIEGYEKYKPKKITTYEARMEAFFYQNGREDREKEKKFFDNFFKENEEDFRKALGFFADNADYYRDELKGNAEYYGYFKGNGNLDTERANITIVMNPRLPE